MSNNDKKPTKQANNLNTRRDALDKKLAKYNLGKKKNTSNSSDAESTYAKSAIAMGFRLSADFISAIAVGVVLGYLLDKFVGTSPFGIIIFVLLGFAAGVLNILRSLGYPIPFERDNSQKNSKND